jgi:hypothetical protein
MYFIITYIIGALIFAKFYIQAMGHNTGPLSWGDSRTYKDHVDKDT